jgi:ATP adenylyltransferase
MEYLDNLRESQSGCFFCDYRDDPGHDDENLVLRRGEKVFSVLNRFPYTGGHALIAPYEHVGELQQVDSDTMAELMRMVCGLQRAMSGAMSPDGFNVGFNLGRCAGAGIPDHIHAHLVPRWAGDTNFMPVLGDVKVIPEFLSKTRERILRAWDELAGT